MNSRKSLLLISIILLVSPILVAVFFNSSDKTIILKIIALIVIIIVLLFNVSNKIIFNPSTFMYVFLGSAIFATMRLSTQIETWNSTMYLILICTAISYLIPCYILCRNNKILNIENFKLDKRKVEIVSSILVLVSLFASAYEYYQFGGIPIFTENLEVVRFQVRISGYIHILAIMSRVSFIIIGSYWISNKKINIRTDKRLIVKFVLSFTLLLFTGFRGELIVPIAILMIQYFIFNAIKYKKIFLYLLIIIIILGVWPIFRSFSSYGDSYIQNLIATSTYPNLFFLLPFYLTFAMNFEILRRLTLTFPIILGYGVGYYSLFVPFSTLLPGDYATLYDVQNKVWDTGFYSGLTSTYLGSIYADGGIFYIIVFNIILATGISILYNRMKTKQSWALTAVYSYVMYLVFLGVYSYGLTIDNILYIILVYIVYRFCSIKVYKEGLL